MTPQQQRILDLRDRLNRHNHSYYVLNAPEISDREFDELMKELEALEAANPEMADPYSPTRRYRFPTPIPSRKLTNGSIASARLLKGRNSKLWVK